MPTMDIVPGCASALERDHRTAVAELVRRQEEIGLGSSEDVIWSKLALIQEIAGEVWR